MLIDEDGTKKILTLYRQLDYVTSYVHNVDI